MECTRCGACCVAPDIAALDKPLGMRCPHLTEDNLCWVYEHGLRCAAATRRTRCAASSKRPPSRSACSKYLALFGLTAEAEATRQKGCASMRRARGQS